MSREDLVGFLFGLIVVARKPGTPPYTLMETSDGEKMTISCLDYS